ncbi:hypothetical protein SAMN02745121_03950 [Nannocystis exedens]|uniref:Uncharacterized protein n=1 Tax=Nannocystis exedens TaxID=54 RepID=A0A1I1ZWG3_9BACT|nr:hypothetical protein [Nannocystis exedens]PCC75325.1 hypothetical protein NAEX_08435 [Nannocystis exedens]SFE34890.1 hypothetical protein SAMN02745121_03950 [Nannocystis exedens]
MHLNYRPLVVVCALLACGPKSPGTTDGTTTGTTTDGPTTTSTTAPTTTPTTTEGAPEHTRPSTEQQLCIDLCLNLGERDPGCSRADYTCYEWCMAGFTYAEHECRDELRAARRCEAEATAFDDHWACESPECASVYAALDVCRGYCSHLGGVPSSGSSTQQCDWGSDCLDGHEYEMQCATGDAPLCTCWIDNTKVGTCLLAGELEAFSCGELDLFDGCCNEFFLPVLQPAAVDEPIPSEPEASGTASPGDPCPLVGLNLPCEQNGSAGLTYCDDIGGSVRFGPCIAEPDCDLLAAACEGTCQLLEGVPTWVEQECSGESTSG